MAKRKSTGKRLRFEIFKRDNFTCQYCGAQPPDVVLVVDHITPVAEGGDSDPINLITACEPCNQGKADKKLGNISPKPDADLEWLSMQQEIAELRRYQLAKKERDRLMKEVVQKLQDTWTVYWNDEYVPLDSEILKWVTRSSPEIVEEATTIAAGQSFRIRNFSDKIRYTGGVIKNLIQESADNANAPDD